MIHRETRYLESVQVLHKHGRGAGLKTRRREGIMTNRLDLFLLPGRGGLRVGMVTTCLPKARDGHRVSA